MRRIGDRSDGRKLRHINPLFRVIPHIMTKRSDAQVFFESEVKVEETYKLIKSLRSQGLKVGFLHVVLAAIVRTLVERPKLNRFVRGRKIYARNEIAISFAIKREMSDDGEETTVKIIFDKTDTLEDVIKKVNETVLENKDIEANNDTDKAAKFFNILPNVILTGVIGILKSMDNHGILPKFLIKLSPFHTSAFVTDLGSLRISPIYHHIYDFGTTSMFISFGPKRRDFTLSKENEIENCKKIDFKIVADERIVDGYYFANSLRMAMKYIQNPQDLMTKPQEIKEDDEI
jgi:hypothetical protein